MNNGLYVYYIGLLVVVALFIIDATTNTINIAGNGIISLKNKFKKNERTKEKDIPNLKN